MSAEAIVSRESLILRAAESLQRHNFEVYNYCVPRINFCFDLVARHPDLSIPMMLLKFCENIDRIHPFIVQELKLFSYLLHALPLLIGIRNRREALKDNVIYERNNLPIINETTFERILDNPKSTFAIAKRGGYFQEVDGSKLREYRIKHNLSQEQLGKMIGVSRKSVASYENESMRASIDHLKKLKEIFNDSFTQPFDFFSFVTGTIDEDIQKIKLNLDLQKKFKKNVVEFIKMVNEIVERTGYRTFWPGASPLDVLIYEDDEDSNRIKNVLFFGGTVYVGKDKLMFHYQEEFLTREMSFSNEKGIIYDEEVSEPFIKKEALSRNLPLLTPEELKLLENPDEFRKFILRKYHLL